jgi:hypothetical protein
MAYADDVLIIARTKQTLIDTFQQLKNNLMQVGLIINEKKTKYLKSTTTKIIRFQNLNGNGLHIEQVQQYKYLGFIINDSNSIEGEIKERIALGIKAYYANLKSFKSRLVTKYSKLTLYRTVITPMR